MSVSACQCASLHRSVLAAKAEKGRGHLLPLADAQFTAEHLAGEHVAQQHGLRVLGQRVGVI